jgi:hypothetical protein
MGKCKKYHLFGANYTLGEVVMIFKAVIMVALSGSLSTFINGGPAGRMRCAFDTSTTSTGSGQAKLRAGEAHRRQAQLTTGRLMLGGYTAPPIQTF